MKGLVSVKARKSKTICISVSGLEGEFSDALRGVASKNFSGNKSLDPCFFSGDCSKKRLSPTFLLSPFKIHKAYNFPVEWASTA